ncbi:VOC family protein [Curtobacterium sp. MCPF17_046]|uniref:VOC family protein n=1 Tax=Curtobacterium sp. MCPF17_046 TaxID=2175663 RepID=UPI000D9BEC3B|nr:VOC family protein [Curtobacterium sp. MCPF17_046]PYY38885.1 VOC family protein [Curtobacterium sp. MCPF17_046]
MIGSLDVVVLDCPDPAALARFYAELLGGVVEETETLTPDDEWVEVTLPFAGHRPLLAFQRVDDYRAPVWPGQDVPQQAHLDVKVDDLDAGERAVLAIGAAATGEGTDTFRVYLDPAGHPFCLVRPQD